MLKTKEWQIVYRIFMKVTQKSSIEMGSILGLTNLKEILELKIILRVKRKELSTCKTRKYNQKYKEWGLEVVNIGKINMFSRKSSQKKWDLLTRSHLKPISISTPKILWLNLTSNLSTTSKVIEKELTIQKYLKNHQSQDKKYLSNNKKYSNYLNFLQNNKN